MTEFNPRNPHSRPNTPLPTTWFEFLLDETLLEKHLSQENPDPPGHQLIVQFLQHADCFTSNSKDPSAVNGADAKQEDNQGNGNGPEVETKKKKALKLLALKTAAFLKWDLDIFDQKLPLTVVSVILSELVKTAFPQDIHPDNLKEGELSSLPNETVFALMLYHRWCVKTVLKDSFPSKPVKTMNVQVPGLVDATLNLNLNGANKQLLENIKSQLNDSVLILEKCSRLSRPLKVPTIHSIGSLNEERTEVEHQWENGVEITNDEIICQICFDLGCYCFYFEDYQRAADFFNKCQLLVNKVQSPQYLNIDPDQLQGYCTASSSLLGEVVGVVPKQLSLLERMEQERKNGFKAVGPLLKEDNKTRELSLSYRNSIEKEVKALGNASLSFQVTTCNVVRHVMEGKALLSEYTALLGMQSENEWKFLIETISDSIRDCSFLQKTNIKCFVQHLCQSLPERKKFTELVLSSEAKSLFNDREVKELRSFHQEDDSFKQLRKERRKSEGDPPNSVGDLEMEVILTYNPQHLEALLHKLQDHLTRQQVVTISDKWKVPRNIQHTLDSLQPGFSQVFTFILLAKAKECLKLKKFDTAKSLLLVADSVIKDISYKLSKLIRWEVLKADLLQYQERDTNVESSVIQDITKRAKTCITSLRLESDIAPSNDIIGPCVSFLLNTKDWGYISNLDNTGNGFIELGRLLACLCNELPVIKNSRKAARELWEAVIQIFTTQTQQKRTSSGAASIMQRDSTLGLLPQNQFIKFITQVKEHVGLSALISCLSKLYNCLRDDITNEISSDYVTLWPSALSSSSSMNIQAVSDSLTAIMKHALTVNPSQPSWLKTQADVYFGQSQHALALHYYLEAGVVATDFFVEQIPKSVFDEHVYKKMIKSCTYLQCHTQVAVLCQFLDETDYVTAFKSLQEKNCNDAMDGHYDCIWDITILEFLVHMHNKRGELDKRQKAIQAISTLDLNSSNSEDILSQAKQQRMLKFLRTMAKHYL